MRLVFVDEGPAASKVYKHAGAVDNNLLFWCAGTFYIPALCARRSDNLGSWTKRSK